MMKKIIDGRKYDTETAKYLGSSTYSNPSNNHYRHEELYRKKNGEYFLYGEGGSSSVYASQLDVNFWGSGEAIIPMTDDEARKWAEKELSVDEYEEIFGEVEE